PHESVFGIGGRGVRSPVWTRCVHGGGAVAAPPAPPLPLDAELPDPELVELALVWSTVEGPHPTRVAAAKSHGNALSERETRRVMVASLRVYHLYSTSMVDADPGLQHLSAAVTARPGGPGARAW